MENNENKNVQKNNVAPWSPVAFAAIDPRIVRLGNKSSEEKLYIILYNYEENNCFEICNGRIECCKTIERLLNSYSIDIHNSVILVEIPAINSKGEAEWVLKHPEKAMSIYQFAKRMQVYFGENFDIEDYNYENNDPDNDRELTTEELREKMRNNKESIKSEADIFDGEQSLVDVYKEAMKDK